MRLPRPRIPRLVFETDLLILRPPKLRDSWTLYRYLRDPMMRRFLRTPEVPRPLHGMLFVLRSTLDRWRGRRIDLMLHLRETGEVIGCRSYFNIRLTPPTSAEFGMWIARPYWGRKLGADGWRPIEAYLYEPLKVHRMYFRVHENNLQAKPKENVKGELDWSYEGKLRDTVRRGDRYETLLLYSRLRTEPHVVEWLRKRGIEIED